MHIIFHWPDLAALRTLVEIEILAGEGYYAGLVWGPIEELDGDLGAHPAVVTLIDHNRHSFFSEAVASIAEFVAARQGEIRWATEVSIVAISDLKSGSRLQRNIDRRLRAAGNRRVAADGLAIG